MDISYFGSGIWKTSQAGKIVGNPILNLNLFWVMFKMASLKLGSRCLRNLVKHPLPRGHEFCQISYYSPTTGGKIESYPLGMPCPPPPLPAPWG